MPAGRTTYLVHLNFRRLFRTVHYLRPRQLYYQLLYRLSGRLVQNGARAQVRSSLGAGAVLPPLPVDAAIANALPVRLTEAGFCFLNRTLRFTSFAGIDWNHPDHGKLWTYNLNYFEYLRQPGLDPDVGEQLIGSWVTHEDTHADGWEPYPTSLRLVNWLQFYRSLGKPLPARVHGSVRRQYVSLWRKLEYHLGGNHLLENALALALTARYLNDQPGTRRADRLLYTELRTQYLPDGQHYERSVMYHLVLLWRQLDVYSWLRTDHSAGELKTALQRQLAWANYIITPDGRFPHFNDSAPGIAPEWAAVRKYAEALRLMIGGGGALHGPFGRGASHRPDGPATASAGIRPTEESVPTEGSYFVWQWAADTSEPRGSVSAGTASPPHPFTPSLWLDLAPIGPDPIPGHAHADSLTFVLHCAGKPLIIDPAVSTYEKNARRAWERSTRAHNTVTVDGDRNSSEVWGGFRVGRRARTTLLAAGADYLSASHDGFPATVHRRSFVLTDGTLRITDLLSGRHTEGTARLHFAPGLVPFLNGTVLTVGPATINFTGAESIELFDYQAAVGWNELRPARGVAVVFSDSLTTEVSGLVEGL